MSYEKNILLQPTPNSPLPTLPPELWRNIIDAVDVFATCTLRRHIVYELRRQDLMKYTPDMSIERYHNKSFSHDRQARSDALALMDYKEKALYRDIRQNATSIYNFNKTCRACIVLAEREWLRKPPMDFKTFQDFCTNPRKDGYQNREDLVIEMFSQDDFLHPPPEVRDPTLVGTPMKPSDIALLGPIDDVYMSISPSEPHRLMYCALMDLWIREVKRLPDTVRNVQVVHKRPFKEMSQLPGSSLDSGKLSDLTQVLQNMRGTNVFGGLLM
ncbi:hypothetical protein LTR37_015192 [Vermiconidia calcicola]|uniref:Uncharacterized protein n=1 Tax=Vermiconidia calcicola TaxID=1690605 RepID=A0ACC3MRC5_9PEZI|nr:hypothetical protein LTR37_015192 [Vermiconidia calcicola]